MKTIGIIGGGASGMMAALAAADEQTKVIILEHTDKIGKKILSTGNGKCNYTNRNISEDDYYNNHPSFVMDALAQFGPQDMELFLKTEGVLSIEKRGGYLYPYSGQASTILEFFQRKLKEKHIAIDYNVQIHRIAFENNHYIVKAKENSYQFDRLIIAAGGKAASVTGSDGSAFAYIKTLDIQMEKLYPVLTPIYVLDEELSLLAGVRTNGKAVLKVDGQVVLEDTGEIQFTKEAVSGIPVFQLCHEATKAFDEKKDVKIWVDYLPNIPSEETKAYLMQVIKKGSGVSVCELLSGMVHKKIALAICKRIKLKENTRADELSEKQIKKINSCLHQFVFTMSRQSDFSKAQATRGGVSLDEMDSNMMVRKYPGLYIIGEMLDVDGKCGGYNLQWAFTSGYIAGNHAKETF